MRLIIKILISVLLFQFTVGWIYMKYTNQNNSKKVEILQNSFTLKKVKKDTIVAKRKALPISTEYTDYSDNQKKPIVKVVKSIKTHKIDKKIKITKAIESKEKVKITKVIGTNSSKPILKVYKKIEKKIKLSSQIEKYAKKMLGKKYVWGATGPKCYDCSGFTQRVFRKVAGIKLPRVSYLQAKVGKKISFKKLKQGDMVFFDTEKKRTGRVNHVGIYLRNGNFIHASSGGKKVIITNFRKKRFYKNRFLWGRRVIKDRNPVAINNSTKINFSKLN